MHPSGLTFCLTRSVNAIGIKSRASRGSTCTTAILYHDHIRETPVVCPTRLLTLSFILIYPSHISYNYTSTVKTLNEEYTKSPRTVISRRLFLSSSSISEYHSVIKPDVGEFPYSSSVDSSLSLSQSFIYTSFSFHFVALCKEFWRYKSSKKKTQLNGRISVRGSCGVSFGTFEKRNK